MTDLLLRIFVKNYKDTNDMDVRRNVGVFASVTGIALNVLLVLGKGLVGIISGSVSIIADALNNLMDAVGSVITLIGFKFASKKADKEHPFGHGRFEYLSGLAVAVLVLLVGIELGKSSFMKIINPTEVKYGYVALVILLVSVLVKLWMSFFTKNLGKRIDSSALVAVSYDSRNDAITTLVVLLTAIVSFFTKINLDGIAGFGVAIFIIYSGISLIKETTSPLLGESPPAELVESITNKINSYECVIGIHDLLVHDYGPGRRYASAHVELSSDIDPFVAHGYIDSIEKDINREENINIVIHYDPV